MEFPERFSNLPEYTWPRMRALLDPHTPGGDVVNLTIGEPSHAFPDFLVDAIKERVSLFGDYPNNYGTPELLGAIGGWIKRRYGVTLAEEQIMALNGTREGLFSAAIALSPETKNGQRPAILLPNPFYPVYMIAALSAGAEPIYMPATAETGHLPDLDALDAETLDRTTIMYMCSPSNPQGAVASRGYWQQLLTLAEKHDFRIFSDECYSEVWRDEPPIGGLEMVQDLGADPERVFVFHSLSKRSNLPGVRSGFVAGGLKGMTEIRQLRAYAGAPLPGPLQHASIPVWEDEAHVDASRQRYRDKFEIADRILGQVPGYASPPAGFFLWLKVENGEAAALKAWRETGVRILPGAYLARDVDGVNPGGHYVRVALVADEPELERGLTELRDCIYT